MISSENHFFNNNPKYNFSFFSSILYICYNTAVDPIARPAAGTGRKEAPGSKRRNAMFDTPAEAMRPLPDLLNGIREREASFSAAQRLVAGYVLENYHQIPFLSISALAKDIGVSDNTIIKFCNQLGFTKFTEFKRCFSEYAHNELVMFHKVAESLPSDETNAFSLETAEDIAAIQTTLGDPMNRASMEKLVPMINSASHVYITGGRASGAMASYLTASLRYLGLRVHVITDGTGDYFDKISMIGKDDLVIAISLPRYTSQIISGIRFLHGKGVPVAVITDTGLSPAHPYGDVIFHCSVSSGYYQLCFLGCMSLIGVICRTVASSRKESASKQIHQIESHLVENVFES